MAASQQHQQQQQLLLPQPQEGTDLAEVPDSTLAAAAGAQVVLALPTKHSITVSSSCSCQATQCTTSSVAGWSEVLLPATAIAPATAATASLPAATADPAAAATAPEDAPLEPLAHPAAAAAAADAADDDDILSLSPNLAAKLRKLESGLSFRMLQPELSTSLKASDSLPPDSATGASCCTTPAFKSGSFVLNASDSGSATGPVSRRSTPFGVLPLSLSRLSPSGLARALNPSGDQTLQTPADQTTALPATIPEHSSVSDGSNAVSTSAAVAAAFAADAAAVQDLVEAAAAAPPAPKPHHSRSKSAVPLTTAPEPPTSPTLGLQDASIHTTEAASLPPTAVLAEVPPTTPGGGSSSSSPAQLPAGRVTRTLSVSSSPFAQVDLQQAVTASLLAQQQPKAVPLHSTPADLAADSAAAAAAASRHAGSTPTSGFGAGSSTYRNLAALQQAYQQQQQQQQQVMQVSVASAPLYTPMPGNSSSVGMRPSLTSKLSWASSVTGVTGVTAGPTAAAAAAAAAIAPEPQAQVFAVLDLTGMTTGTVGAAAAAAAAAEGAAATGTVTFRTEEGEADDSVPRVLCPSKSFSTLSQLKRGNSNSSSSGGSSSFGRVESFGVNWGGKGAKPGSRAKGIFSLGRVKSAVAVLGGLSRMQSLPARRLKSAPETSRAPDAAAGAGSRMGSGQSSSNGSSDGSLAAMEAAPALSTPISAAGSNISVKPAVAAAAAAVSGNPVRCVQTQPVTPPQQQQGNLLSPNPSRQLAGLPPLPRPPSSFSLDQAAAAAAAGSSAAEGPFALQQQAALDASILAAAGTPLANSSSSSGGTPGGSSSLLLSSTQHSSTWRLSGSISYAPMGSYQLPETRSYGASSIGQLSSSGSSHGTNGSLMSLAVTRMHSAAAASASHSCGNLPSIASGGSSGSLTSGLSNPRGSVTAGLASQQSGSMPTLSSLDSGGIPASLASSSKSSSEVARAFAEAFLAALSAGNTKWASEAAVGDLLADAAKMVGLDKQLYVGKTAIIRRLNGGMEQLVKMAQATATDSSSSSSNASPGDATAATAAGSSGSIASLAKQLPKPQLTVSCPDPKGKPSVVEAVYSFRWGIRKFTMRDEFIVRGGQVLRLRRSRG